MAIASSIAKAKFWQKGKGIQQLQKNFKVNDRFLREKKYRVHFRLNVPKNVVGI